MLSETSEGTDDRWTVIAVAAVACMLQSALHECLGHGGVAFLSGARTITLSTVAMNAVIASAIPATMGANAGTLSLPRMVGRGGSPDNAVPVIRRNRRWIASAAVLLVLFVFVLGRGLTWHR